jgi:hypothetical protein
MHEVSGESAASVEPAASGDSAASDQSEAATIEALPLAERAPEYQAVADRLRSALERSDPSRGDA